MLQFDVLHQHQLIDHGLLFWQLFKKTFLFFKIIRHVILQTDMVNE